MFVNSPIFPGAFGAWFSIIEAADAPGDIGQFTGTGQPLTIRSGEGCMGPEKSLFRMALGLAAPWYVDDVGDDRLWRVPDHHVPAARAQEDVGDVSAVGVDETAARRGHEYITLFHDLRAGRLLFACEGRDAGAVETFAEDLRAPGGDPDAIPAAIPAACIAGVGRHLPRARRPGAPRCAVSRR